MKLENFNVKSILALFIVIFGMSSIVFMILHDTTENSIINLIIMVVSYYFGYSSGSAAKDKAIIDVRNASADDIGGSTPPVKTDEK